MAFTLAGNIVDIRNRNIFPGRITIENNLIQRIVPDNALQADHFILPGFVDAHVHIESSMLIPAEFARLAVVHGTVATVSDPHEIANVCGRAGVEFMIENGHSVPFKFNFGAPSCVPATAFETAGAVLDAGEVEALLERKEVRYLSEMMNFPGVLLGNAEVLKKISAAKKYQKPIDGHAPGLRGDAARQYISAGISTDHECFTREEALEKLQYGMSIIIREGSAAKNFEALIDLLPEYPEKIMFCSDDKHPDSLAAGHINQLCARAVAKGINVFQVLQAACVNPVLHYRLDVGLLQEGDPADFVVVKSLENFDVVQTYIQGQLVADNGQALFPPPAGNESFASVNSFNCQPVTPDDLETPWKGETEIPVIVALDGQLITNREDVKPKVMQQKIVCDPEQDVLKIVVVNRYQPAKVAKAYIKNFGLQRGALASSVAHDSHNIVAVGVDDESLCRSINLLIETKGGISCVDGRNEWRLPLPVAGLMSYQNGYEVAKQYTFMDQAAKNLGSTLSAPFMTLSFMALLVIPHLKLSDKGLFDGDSFRFVDSVE